MNKYLTEENMQVIDQRALMVELCKEFELYHPELCLTPSVLRTSSPEKGEEEITIGMRVVAYVLKKPMWVVKRCMAGTWKLSYDQLKKLERAMGCGLWVRFYSFTIEKNYGNR